MAEHAGTRTYTGGCLCGAVRLEADLDLSREVSRCNCTGCLKYAQTGTHGKPDTVRVTKGADHVTRYQRDGHPNWRAFCRVCGVQTHGGGDIPEMGGAFASINLNCLDDVDPWHDVKVHYWDGRHDNWQVGPRPAPWPTKR